MIGIITSEFNEHITGPLQEGCLAELRRQNIADAHITSINVPGAVEIPFVLQRLAQTQQYDVLIALGAVIRGETTHYNYVCEQVSFGCQKIMLDYDIPIIFGILTTENDAQAMDRLGGAHGHKGIDAAQAAIRMIEISRQFVSL